MTNYENGIRELAKAVNEITDVLRKAHVKEHMRTSKTGKVSTVREHDDKRYSKKQLESLCEISRGRVAAKKKYLEGISRPGCSNDAHRAVTQAELDTAIATLGKYERMLATVREHDDKRGHTTKNEKVFYYQTGVGKAKFALSFHDGNKTHGDGSPFYDMRIFKNKKELNEYRQKLHNEGYREKNSAFSD
jgi:hypothetical protein